MGRHALEFPEKDLPLRDDVRLLGALVGEMLKEQGGEELYRRVESARRAAIRRREEETGDEALRTALEGLDAGAAGEVARAFSAYFRVVNLAEKVHRIRRRRDHLRSPGPQQAGGLEDTVRRLQEAGVDAAGVADLLGRLLLEPVFTAHPTEATRRVILEKEQRIARDLVDRLDPSRTPAEERASLERIRAEITAAWQTQEHPEERPSVADEAEHVLFFVTDVLYRVIPPFYEDLQEALAAVYGPAGRALALPVMVRFASWVGGDMDGNPAVSAATLRATLERHRELVLERYQRELAGLAQRLTQSESRVVASHELQARLQELAGLMPQVVEAIGERRRDMPYRTFLHLMSARLQATRRDEAQAYGSPRELRDDLNLLAASLEAGRGGRAGGFAVRRAMRRVETFGFHLAALDVRQDAEVHRAVIGRLLGAAGWEEAPPAARLDRLRRALREEPPPCDGVDAEVDRTLDVFRAIAGCRRRHGEQAVGPYIISMARGADDVLTVLVLARWAGLAGADGADGAVPLDVAPLFETVEDLEAAPETVQELLTEPAYREHLARRGDRQMVMLGYSDSSKDGGLASSRWALHRAQAGLTRVMSQAGIDGTFFHGRGGTIGRGGGKTHRAVMAAPPGAVAGRLRVTEQGEMIAEKYGLRGIALRTLERAFGAVALATARRLPRADHADRFRPVMDSIAWRSRAAYRGLVYEDPAFPAYFRGATPIDVIEGMTIGSRPSSRRPGGGVESLRAIPWVFAWTQSRHLLPGWYGLGAGLAAAADGDGREILQEMVRDWPFLRAMLEDVEMVLAKADLSIAARYAGLAPSGARRIFDALQAEFDRTVEWVLDLQGKTSLLESDLTLQRSIRLRNPYVDPLSLLQVDLLRRWRAGDRADEDLRRALLETVVGIARGLQNTG